MPLTATKGFTFTGKSGTLAAADYPEGFVGTDGAATTTLAYEAVSGDVGVGTAPVGAGKSAMLRLNGAVDARHWAATVRVHVRDFSASQGIIQVRSGSSLSTNAQAAACNLILSGGNPYIQLVNAAGTAVLASVALPDGTYDVQMEGLVGTTTADGKFRGRVVRVSDTTTIYDTGTVTGNFGTGSASHVQFCKTAAAPTLDAVFLNANWWDGDTWSETTPKYLPLASDPPVISDDDPADATGEFAVTHLGRTPGATAEDGPGEPFGTGPASFRTYATMPNGSVGVKYDGDGTGSAFHLSSLPLHRKQSFAMYLVVDRLPTTTVEILNLRSTTANLCSLVLDNVGRLRLNNGAGTENVGTMAAGVTVGSMLLVQVCEDTGTTASNGRLRLRVASPDGATEYLAATRNDLDLGSGVLLAAVRRGKIAASTSYAIRMDGERALAGVFALIQPAQDQPDAGQDFAVEPLWGPVQHVGLGSGTGWGWVQTGGPAVTLTGTGPLLEFDPAPVAGFAEVPLTFAYGPAGNRDTVVCTVLPVTDAVRVAGVQRKCLLIPCGEV